MNPKLQSKKGQINSIAPAVLILVFASVVLVFGLIILQELRDSKIITSVNTETIVNESMGSDTINITEKGLVVSRADGICDFSAFGVNTIVPYNNSLLTVPTSDFTDTADGFVNFTGAVTSHFNNTGWNVTYTYTFGDVACDQGTATIVGLGTFADFWEIIVLAIVITIVIGLLLTVFGGRRQR